MSTLYKKILVPLDGSDLAAQALPHAEKIAADSGAKLILLRVVENNPHFALAPAAMVGAGLTTGVGTGNVGLVMLPTDDDAHRQAMDEAKQSLDLLAEELRYRQIDAEASIDTGDPATQIVDYAADNGVDLIVMSTHGRTGIRRWTYGSVAAKVLQAAPCAVMIVRP